MNKMVTVGIADMQVVQYDDSLVTYALGSCVGICLYDPLKKIGALGHIMLPTSRGDETAECRKYADTCIPEMLVKMEQLGCDRRRLIAKIAGGARMFNVSGCGFDIGDRNVAAVKDVLQVNGINLYAEDTGLDYGRTVYFYTEDGRMLVKSYANGVKAL